MDNNNQAKNIRFNSETHNKNIIFNFIDLSSDGDDLNTDNVELSFQEAFTNDSQQIISLLYFYNGIQIPTQ